MREFRDACGAYPPTLERLRTPAEPAAKWPTCAHFANLDASVIDRFAAGLAPRDDQHYALLYLPVGKIEGGFERYEMEARWLGRDRERRSFWMSEAGVVRIADGRPARADDEPLR